MRIDHGAIAGLVVTRLPDLSEPTLRKMLVADNGDCALRVQQASPACIAGAPSIR
jgi:hypothetical protein